MLHRRSPTHSYPYPATLALRTPYSSIHTLLSPLASIANSPLLDLDDALDDFQSNTWVNTPLAGLGITYFRDTSSRIHHRSPALEDSLRMQVDDGDRMSCLPVEPHNNEMLQDDFSPSKRVPMSPPPVTHDPAGRVELGLDSDVNPMESEIIGLIPDVNMYDRLRRQDTPYTGVNPLDTIGDTTLGGAAILYGAPASFTPISTDSDHVPCPTDPKPEGTPSPRVIQDIMSILVKVESASEPFFQQRSIASSSPAHFFSPSPFTTPRHPTSVKLEPTNAPGCEDHPPTPCTLKDPNSIHSSPVLNAHLGIELSELAARAERFKSRYPERDIDRAWLSHFAGKLSDRGELLNDFRCYVVGCEQRNKRRDHILVHVGAHIGQRPFACSLCSLRFLRKNECKRHEASHTGFRPYSCDICGQTFVRQDLVKRHVKRTHGRRDENQTGATKQSRKKARRQ